MAEQTEPRHPCDRRKPLAPWKANHLYIDDRGLVLCGACMGVESTYMPHGWSDLGRMDADRQIAFTREQIGQSIENLPGADALVMRCESDPKNRSTHPSPEDRAELEQETTMTKPKTTKTSKPAQPKSGGRKPAVGASTPPVEKTTPAEELVVFAFRLTPAERETIHKAAGPAGASRFVRAVAIAAASGDEEAVLKLLGGPAPKAD